MLQISSYEIYGLHDVFNYKLSSDKKFSDVVIFYGNNGSGKTTILKLLFHMLSSSHDKGHRTAIASIPFRRIIIGLSDGTKISATRKEALSFPIEYQIRRTDGTSVKWDHVPKKDREFLSGQYLHEFIAHANLEKHSDQLLKFSKKYLDTHDAFSNFHSDIEHEQAYVKALKDLNINLYLITSDRRIISDIFENFSTPETGRFQPESNVDPIAIARARYLESALNFATRWVRSQIISASNTGAKNSNDIYSDIVTQLANADLQGSSVENADLTKLTKKLKELRALSRSYSTFGLMPGLRIKKLVDAIDGTTTTSQIAIQMVMEPYVSSLQARLDALAPVYNAIQTFVGSLNDFFSYKKISFKAGKGFEIINDWGNVLTTEQLSSGEQQLLLIFCYALAAGDKSSVLIIDEPEISLNVEWQRRLIDSIRKITEGSKNQLVFATHSIELLAQHSENVCPLNPITIPENDPVYEHTSAND